MSNQITVKNWAKFQHFKNRKPPWVKLYRDLLDDMEWHRLDPMAAKILVMLWLIASEDSGKLPDSATLAFRLRVTEVQINKALLSLSHWLDQDDISAISEGYQGDTKSESESTRRERVRERERERGRDRDRPLLTKLSFSEFQNVKLTQEEYDKLAKIHGVEILIAGIDTLGAWLKSTGKIRKDHYACLNASSWVWEKLAKVGIVRSVSDENYNPDELI